VPHAAASAPDARIATGAASPSAADEKLFLQFVVRFAMKNAPAAPRPFVIRQLRALSISEFHGAAVLAVKLAFCTCVVS